MKEIFNRRSIRKFKNIPVEKEKTDRLLRAAMQAPSALNQQPWEFIVVEDKASLQKLSKSIPDAKPVENSGLTLILAANSSKFRFEPDWQSDMSAAAQNILLEAVHLELGAVWISISSVDSAISYVKEMYKLPSHIKPFALIAVGYPDNQKNQFIDRYNAEKIHYEKW
ncbi:nitroreductase family protein [Clostridium sp. MSJ-11]|uniref:Nitroreductase family protein n=1 Tax=Clostridium mobile TaxID=2841512 RepID=A0ABS6EDS8_9CLOT|nr:nitroreductase family protein [Clostridium mobile]MBU5483360.1 nitroreductase family protein [Clostridium mobile]